MANNKTKQTRDLLLDALKENESLPLEILYSKCNCDYDALTGALRSLIEKEEISIGRLKTKNSWLIGSPEHKMTSGNTNWYSGRGQMRNKLPKMLKELRKIGPAPETSTENESDREQLQILTTLLSDGQPRSRLQITAATGLENIAPSVWQRLARLPDRRYTLPDSSGAQEYFWQYIKERPRRLADLLRLFHKHKEIKANILAQLDKPEQLIKLPRALITTTDSAEGKAELERRRQLKSVHEILHSLPQPFFHLNELAVNQRLVKSILDKYAVTAVFNNQKHLCLRREFPAEIVTDQLVDITGRFFEASDTISAPAFLKYLSMGEKEALNLLNIEEDSLHHLLQTEALEAFQLDGRYRLWRNDVQQLKADNTLLRSLTKELEKVSLPQAAVLLNLTIGQVRRLLNEEKLQPLAPYGAAGNAEPLFSHQELEKLRPGLSAILSTWEQLERQNTAPAPLKKRPLRRAKPVSDEQQQPLQLDHFQIKAVEALRANRSVLLSAPTGNGKTLVAEILAQDIMGAGNGIVYTSPLKALSNQKYRDFKETFGPDAVGLVTGDISINPDAPLLIMTTEIFRNWCLGEPGQLFKTLYVIFDEFHYLDDNERGTTWEESILFAPAHIRFLGLSATVPNIAEIAAWVSSVRGEEVIIIEEKKRQVPLEIRWITPNGQIVAEEEARQEVNDMVEYQKALRSKKYWAEE